jgi:quercetin dioxygenase-like cupin family protein
MFRVNQEAEDSRASIGKKSIQMSCRSTFRGVSFAQFFGQFNSTEERGMRKIRTGSVCVCGALLGIAAFTAGVFGQEKKESGEAHKIVHFGDLKWTPIIKGCDLAAVDGDPNAEGAPFVVRLRCVDGAKIPAHWHPTDENVTVLKGTFLVGMGETFDEAKMQTMNVGNFVSMPKEVRHFGLCKGETIVQVHGAGPFKVNWVNPSDVQPPDAPAAAAKPKS